jgi:pimeloyl-ACP methyl ester carboxylesterase
MFRHTHSLLACACIWLAGCTDSPVTPLQTSSPPSWSRIAGAAVVDGQVGQGVYRIHVPQNWNGRLILYAHGYQSPAGPPVLPFEDPIIGAVFEAMRSVVVDQLGYALAYSSSRASGFALQEGVQATQQLRGIFNSKFGAPSHTYLAGHSLGGMVALQLAEQHPTLFDGALVMCSLPGGSRAEVDYIYHTRAVFDAFYPNVLPGSLFDGEALTLPAFLAQYQSPIIAAVTGSAAGLTAAILAKQTLLPGASPDEFGAALLFALFFHHISADDLLSRTHGQPFFDNQNTLYAPSVPLPGTELLFAHLNAAAERASSTPAAEAYLDLHYEPTGSLKIPVLTLHTTRDPVTPAWHEDLYSSRVAAAGASNNLRRWLVPGFGHCNAAGTLPDPAFTVKTVEALLALTAWAEHGIDPGNH